MKLWDGRFSKGTEARADAFQASVSFDQRLYREDIRGSIAHATMLGQQGILSPQDVQVIVEGLTGILADFEADKLIPPPGCEDIHMWVEQELTARIGEAGKRLHTARSRNDQVALDMRLYAKRTCDETLEALHGVLNALFALAEKHAEDVMPGYTHMQRAQPAVGHWALAMPRCFARCARVLHAKNAADSMLGAGCWRAPPTPSTRQRAAVLAFADIAQQLRHRQQPGFCAGLPVRRPRHDACPACASWCCFPRRIRLCGDGRQLATAPAMPQKKTHMASWCAAKRGRTAVADTADRQRKTAAGLYGHAGGQGPGSTRDTYIDCLAMVQGMLSTMQINTRRMEQGAGWIRQRHDCATIWSKGALRDACHYRA